MPKVPSVHGVIPDKAVIFIVTIVTM